MAVSENKTTNHFFAQNPLLSRLSKSVEYDGSDKVCTYGGIARKLAFFVIMIAVGVAANLVLKLSGASLGGEIILDQPLFEDGANVVIRETEAIVILVCGIVFILAPILATFIRPTIPVTGTLYCLSTGFLLSWLATTLGDIYMAPILLALVITLMIVFTMGFLYGMGIVKVGQKMKTVIMTFGIVVLGASLLTFIGSLIPATRGLVSELTNNPILSIGGSVILVIVGTLFLLVDFDTIRSSVENNLPKKYEWYASFGLAFSVIWLYFKVLDLILKIMGSKKN
ncbi:MAG: Bax inhibitor-1/YccA family protein [Ruminiclostridium sp.]|nr:Bax inhibitor-1/YccA family protein [Ruminiclostridium sp.]